MAIEWERCNSATNCDVSGRLFFPVFKGWLFDKLSFFFCIARGSVFVSNGHEDDEFFPPESCNDIGSPGIFFEKSAQLNKEVITRVMAVYVIISFEMIYIKNEYRYVGMMGHSLLCNLFCRLKKIPSVMQSCQ